MLLCLIIKQLWLRVANSPTNPALFIITTSNTIIAYQQEWWNPFNWSSYLCEYAKSRGVNLYQIRTAFNPNTGMVYTDFPQLLTGGISFPINFFQYPTPLVAPVRADPGPDFKTIE